jgi:rod shape-determining protein MreC
VIALRRTFLGYILALILLFFVLHRIVSLTSGYLEAGASLFVYPIIKMQNAIVVPVQKYFKKRKKNDQLQARIALLQEQHANLLAENIALHSLHEYAGKIQELVKFREKYVAENAYLAQIIMKQFSEHEHSFLVDNGSMHGISVDMVAVYKNCLIGRVSEVYPYYSKVVLITDPECKVAAYCRQSKARGIHEGCNKKKQTMLQFVSHLHHLKENDLVISSGEGLVFPQGFCLGRIKSFETDGLYYKILMKPTLKFTELEFCYLIKKSQTN